jgi:4-hydroxybenzoate decarboxylase subunit C
LRRNESARQYLFHVVVSADVPLDDPVLLLWGWFTRFDPDADLYPAGVASRATACCWIFPSPLTRAGKRAIHSPWLSIPRSSGGWRRVGQVTGLDKFKYN